MLLFSEFTNEDVAKVQSELKPGDSLTVTFIDISHQSKPVTLGNIMHKFYQLDRMDILRELETLTAVRFEGRTDADNVSSMSACRPLQANAGDLDQFNNGIKNDNYKITKHAEKHNANGGNALGNRELRADVKMGQKRVEVPPIAEYPGLCQESVEQCIKTNRSLEIHENVAHTGEINLDQTNGKIQVYNNLDMSASSNSSNTQNIMYDDLLDTSSVKDNQVDQEQKMISVKSNDFGARDNKPIRMIEEFDNGNGGTDEFKESVSVCTVEIVEQKEKNEIVQYSAVQESKTPRVQTCGFPKISTASVDSSFQADFEWKILEGKLQSILLRNQLFTGETNTNSATLSIEHYVDQDLQDEIEARTDVPKLSICSDVNSINKKAAKVFSYYGQDCGNTDALFDNDNLEHSDESFQIEFDFQQTPSTDEDMLLDESSERKLQAVHPCDQSNELLHYSVQQPPNHVSIARFNHVQEIHGNEIVSNTNEDIESEIIARGPTVKSDNEFSEIKMTLRNTKTELKGVHIKHSDYERDRHEKQQACSKVSMKNVDNVNAVSKQSLENNSVQILENGNVMDVESEERMYCNNVADTNKAGTNSETTKCAIIKRACTVGADADRTVNTNMDIHTDTVGTESSIARDSADRRLDLEGLESLSTVLNVVKTFYDSIM